MRRAQWFFPSLHVHDHTEGSSVPDFCTLTQFWPTPFDAHHAQPTFVMHVLLVVEAPQSGRVALPPVGAT